MESFQKFQDDNIEVKSYIDKKTILQYISEEDLFEHILGFVPKEYDYICSPLREDNNPGAFFQRGLYSNKLLFIDYADSYNNTYDCFAFIQRYYKLPDFYQTLQFIQHNIIEKQKLEKTVTQNISTKDVSRKKAELIIEARPFNKTDGLYWGKFGISKKNLMDDKVFPVQKIFLKNGRKGDKSIPVYTKCYAFTDFKENRKKLYFPYKKGKFRFLSTCTRNDVDVEKINRNSKQLVISKSYKDCRVLRNLGVNTLWFQNEGAFPENLQEIIEGFEDVAIFFDNDNPGINAAMKLESLINNSFRHVARTVHFETKLLEKGIKDPADMYSKMGVEKLEHFLSSNNIIYETNRCDTQQLETNSA